MITFLRHFFKLDGTWVASAFFISKISAFLLTFFMARMLSKDDFGWVMYGLNFLGFFIPFVGMGSAHGSLRYAALSSKREEQQKIITYAFTYGFLLNFITNGLMLLFALFIFGNGPKLWIVLLFSLRLFGLFFLEQAKSEARGQHNNQKFGLLEFTHSIFMLLSALLFTFFFGVEGYVFSLCISPFVVLLFHKFRFAFRPLSLALITKKEFWQFCISMAVTSQLSEMIFLLDVFFIGIFLDHSAVADYRIFSIIPFNLFFLAALFFQTAYPELCTHHKDNKYQLRFLFNFWKFIVPVSVLILLSGFMWAEEILGIFGSQYGEVTTPFKILLAASVSVLLLRTPFGYLLASRGKSRYNLISAVIALLSLSIFIKPVIAQYGLLGVAYLSLFHLLFIGVFLAICFYVETNKSKINP